MKIAIVKILSLFILLQSQIGFSQDVTFEKADPFSSRLDAAANGEIDWGYLNVPESWEKPDGKKIKIAVLIYKNKSKKTDADPVVFIQGGPGASGLVTAWTWLNHPLRESNDIVLFDVRGTGRSKPRMCPDLGQKFLDILAKNQSEEKDEKEKSSAALSCKQDLINKDIDITAYNSKSVANDLHALKEALQYKSWNVYGVSYGTYMAQVYAATYPEDIQKLILDSSIDDISTYYVNNTSNYMGSLQKVFDLCKNDKQANAQYPDLENVYYEVIKELNNHPLTVTVDKSIISTGEFTYNTEDFKIAIQQALYDKKLVEVIPLLIYQFRDKNKEALGNLVAAFSSLLAIDYGLYYCVSCNETLFNNDYSSYKKNAAEYPLLDGGIAFYKSDFKVCEEWNKNSADSLHKITDLSNLSEANYPVLIFSGEFDPITPQGNGKRIADKFQNGTLLLADTYGHAPGFTKAGKGMTNHFMNDNITKESLGAFSEVKAINLAKNIEINKGVSKMGDSINEMNPLFLLPLAIALVMMLGFSLVYLVKLIRKRYSVFPDKFMRFIITITSITGLVVLGSLISALLAVSEKNLYILAFGLPETYHYIFMLALVFLGLLILSVLYYFFTIKKTNERSVLFSIVFSNMLLATYLFYWGIVSF